MKHFIVLFFLVLLFGTAKAQTQVTPKDSTDVRVGLVLSGGGAKGLAHIGALKVIDSLGIRVNYIAGSSMGAIIGGLYASGYTAKQLDSLFREVAFNDMIQDVIPRNAKTFYEKEKDERYALSLPIVDGKVSLPKGLSNGQNFYNFYSEISNHVRDIENFEDFSVPFFCTGTDIETGKRVLFDKGYLPDVVAASSALPSVYSPVEYDGKLVTDGGISDNYPVEEIRRRNVDYVIGVDVQDTLMTRKQLRSVADIMLQISNFRTIKAMKDKAPLTDVYIRPNMNEYSVLSFGEGEDIIKEGADSARDQLMRLVDIAEHQKNTVVRAGVRNNSKIKIDEINIQNNKNYTRSYVKGKLQFDIPSTINYRELTNGLNNLYSTGNFDRLRYRIHKDSINNNILDLTVKESNLKRYVRFGLHFDDLYKSSALVNYTHKNLLLKNDVFLVDLIVGDEFRYNLEYYVDQGNYWSVGITNRLSQFEINVDFGFVRDRRGLPDLPVQFVDVDYVDITSQIYGETIFKHKLGLRIGAEHKYLRVKTNTLDEEIPGTVFDELSYFGLFGKLRLDNLNDKYFPTRGLAFDASFEAYPLSSQNSDEFEEFAVARSKIFKAISISPKFSSQVSLEGGVRLGRSEGINSLDFFLGGYGAPVINNQVSFLGYDFLEISGDSYIKSLFQLDYNFYKKHHLIATANYGNVGSRIFNFQEWIDRVGYSGYALGYGVDTIIGPIQVKYTFSPDINTSSLLFISVGYIF